jgi:PTH1 family peptidyl-tRNA hydrolase
MTHNAQVNVIVGLGNPGPEYSMTYHNAGMLALPALAARLAPDDAGVDGSALAFARYKHLFEYARGDRWAFVRPLTYMNDSGRAVKEALRVLDAMPGALMVAHDDSDLPLGAWKIARGGGAAGHKGILSIVDHLGTNDFIRIRIGIRDPQEAERKKAGDFVLSPIGARERETLEKVFMEIAESLRATYAPPIGPA